MNQLKYILLLIGTLLFVGCSDEIEQPERDIDFCLRAAWQDGCAEGGATRALSASDLLADGTSDIVIDYADYPATIDVHCSDGTDFILAKSGSLCNKAGHTDYWSYIASVIYKDKEIRDKNLTFTAKAKLDGIMDGEGNPIDGSEDLLVGECDQSNLDGTHMLLTLHHAKALLRFAFRVDNRYDKIRYIKVKKIVLNGVECYVKNQVLPALDLSNPNVYEYISYAYVDPTVVTLGYENTLQCTYDIYDKDAAFPVEGMTPEEVEAVETELAKHLTRQDIVAQNKFRLNNIVFSSSSPENKVLAGYYYDLHVTLNPDYLYVLSDHDNKHLTVN